MVKTRYRRKIRKTLAVLMSASMILSSVSISAFATETEEKQSAPTVTVTVTETKSGGNTTTTTVTEKEWNETEELEFETEAAESESTTEQETGAAETETTAPETESTEPQNGTVVTGGTTVTGKETTTENVVVNGDGKVIREYGSIDGSETTTTEVITTTTEIKENQQIDETTTEINTSESSEGETVTTTGTWEEGTPEFGEYENGTWTDNAWESGTSTETTTTTDVAFEDVLASQDKDVVLDLTPGGTGIDDTEIIYVSWSDIENNSVSIPTSGTTTEKDAEGNTVTTKTTVKEIKNEQGKVVGYEVEKVTTTTKISDPTPGEDIETGSTTGTTTTSAPALPDGVVAGTEELKDEAGNVIGSIVTTIEELKDESGNVIGYTITKTKTEDHHNETDVTSEKDTITENADPVEEYILPEKPQASESTDAETGVKTVVTVAEIKDDSGKVLGYTATTVETDKKGKELSRLVESFYGTTVVTNKTTVTDPTTETTITDTTITTVTTTTIMGTTTTREVDLKTEQTTDREIIELTEDDTWQMVTTADGKNYFMYQGAMYEVKAVGNHGQLSNNLDVKVDLNMYAPNGSNDVRANPHDGGGYTGQILDSNEVTKNGYKYFGYGLYSNFLINDTDNEGHDVRQYAIKDAKGNVHYVYCVEMGAGLESGSYYGEKKMTNGALYPNNNGDVTKLTSVAQNGFWGTADGIGSLTAVKDLLTRNGYGSVADSLTAGQALAATQAAIWNYGTAGSDKINTSNLIKGEFTYNGSPGVNWENDISDEDKTNITTLCNLLISLANSDAKAGIAETIDADDITGATIILDKKATNGDGTVKTDAKGNELYKSNLSFQLAVSTSSINGDLIVKITNQDGEVIATRRLAGDDSKTNYGKIVPDANGNYTIENVELAEGVMITLNLSGTQHLADGVYVYQSADFQDFVGLSKLERKVNLSVDMKFEVTEPDYDLVHNDKDSVRTKNDTYTETRTGSRTDTREDYTTKTDEATTEVGAAVTTVYADVTVVEVETKTQVTENKWDSEWNNRYKYNEDDPDDTPKNDPKNNDPGKETTGGDPSDPAAPNYEVVVHDMDVPLGNVVLDTLPKTGDSSVIWLVMSILSGLGLAGVSLTEKKRKEE